MPEQKFFKLRDALQLQHETVMMRLYAALARNRGIEVYGELGDVAKQHIVSDAARMCEQWAADPALRETYEAGKNDIVDLVAKQFHLEQQIAAADTEGVATLSKGARARR